MQKNKQKNKQKKQRNSLNYNLFKEKQSIAKMLVNKDHIRYSLSRKKLLSNNLQLINKNNKIYENYDIFYGTQKILRYKKIYLIFKRKKWDKNKNKSKNLNSKKKFKKINKKLKSKSFITWNKYTKINVLNRFLSKGSLVDYYKNSIKWKYSLFPRSEALFYDFVKILNLTERKLIESRILLYVFGLVFKTLHKRKHARFIRFAKEAFEKSVERERSRIKGIRFVLSGRLKGKPRSSTIRFKTGKLTLNEVDATISNSQLHVYTLYGAFGMKLWINYK